LAAVLLPALSSVTSVIRGRKSICSPKFNDMFQSNAEILPLLLPDNKSLVYPNFIAGFDFNFVISGV